MSKVYQYVQQSIIKRIEDAIEKGEKLPWQKPWNGKKHVNYVTRHQYRGINLLLLPEADEYITFRQIQDLQKKNPEIRLKKGSKSHMVVYWSFNNKRKKKKIDENTGEEVVVDTLEYYEAPIFRYYNVFSINDVEGLETKFSGMDYEHNGVDEAEKLIVDYKKELDILINHGQDRAYYSISGDYISIPDKSQFDNVLEFYSTIFHEMVHSTGHPKRLKRFKEGEFYKFGSESYSEEELVAEIGANMLMGELGIYDESAFDNSIAYMQGWLQAIKNDVRFITIAAQRAQKATDYILGKKY